MNQVACLFPCNANFCHVKRKGKKCRWCEKTDRIEDEDHILIDCSKSPISEGNYDYKDIVFEGEEWNPEILDDFIKEVFKYKDILRKRNERF